MRFYILLLFIGLFHASALRHSSADGREEQGERVKVKGRVVCLDASGRPSNGPIKCEDSSHGFGLMGADGAFYNFLQEDPSAAIFTDPRVRERELMITARAHHGNRLEIIQVQSIHGGKLYDIFYFCEVCNITAYAPGPCTCCRQEFEFRETPARAGKP